MGDTPKDDSVEGLFPLGLEVTRRVHGLADDLMATLFEFQKTVAKAQIALETTGQTVLVDASVVQREMRVVFEKLVILASGANPDKIAHREN